MLRGGAAPCSDAREASASATVPRGLIVLHEWCEQALPQPQSRKFANLRQGRWKNSRLHRTLNQFRSEEYGPPKRSKAIVWK